MRALPIALTFSLCLPALARADDRPSEDVLFGAPAANAETSSQDAPTIDARPSEDELFGGRALPNALPSVASERGPRLGAPARAEPISDAGAPLDPLKIGGQLYLRAQTTGFRGQGTNGASFGAPSLLDVYLDSRPNDRVRGFALGRLIYDPTLPDSASSATGIGSISPSGTNAGSPSLSALSSTSTRAPVALVDQLWIRFDIARRVFVTAGKQHVRWGTGRFWMPTDLLHLRRRDPLAVFDARTGTTMLKLHLPIESKSWNFYAFGIPESVASTVHPSRIAAALRAEFVVDTVEFGLGAYLRKGIAPKLAGDFSAALGPLDVYGEMAVLQRNEIDRVRYAGRVIVAPPPMGASWQSPSDLTMTQLQQTVDATYPTYRAHGYRPQLVLGAGYSHAYNDGDQWTVGAEYFYNGLGYDDTNAYAGLVLPHSTALQNPATFFYLGEHYAALYASLPAPYSWDLHSFTLSTLGNLSDRSFIMRFDYALTLLTHLRLETFAAVHLGPSNGELRFGFAYANLDGTRTSHAPAAFDLGLALRMSL